MLTAEDKKQFLQIAAQTFGKMYYEANYNLGERTIDFVPAGPFLQKAPKAPASRHKKSFMKRIGQKRWELQKRNAPVSEFIDWSLAFQKPLGLNYSREWFTEHYNRTIKSLPSAG